MRVNTTAKRPCAMERGEMCRIPRNPRFGLVGFQLACPRCGFVIWVVNDRHGQAMAEHEDGTVSFAAPVTCLVCKTTIRLDHSEATMEEAPGVPR